LPQKNDPALCRAVFVRSGVFVVELADRRHQILDVIDDLIDEIGKCFQEFFKTFHEKSLLLLCCNLLYHVLPKNASPYLPGKTVVLLSVTAM
jgi:hypothetical protein